MDTPLEAFTTTKCSLLPLNHIPQQILLPFYESFQSTLAAIQPSQPQHVLTKRHYVVRRFFANSTIRTPMLFSLNLANQHDLSNPSTVPNNLFSVKSPQQSHQQHQYSGATPPVLPQNYHEVSCDGDCEDLYGNMNGYHHNSLRPNPNHAHSNQFSSTSSTPYHKEKPCKKQCEKNNFFTQFHSLSSPYQNTPLSFPIPSPHQNQPDYSGREILTTLFNNITPSEHNSVPHLFSDHTQSYEKTHLFNSSTPTFQTTLASQITIASSTHNLHQLVNVGGFCDGNCGGKTNHHQQSQNTSHNPKCHHMFNVIPFSLPPSPIITLTNHWGMLFPTMSTFIIFTLSYFSLRTTPLSYLKLSLLSLLHHHASTIKQIKESTSYGGRVSYPYSPLLYRFILIYDDTYQPISTLTTTSTHSPLDLYNQIEKILLQYLKPHQFLLLPQSLYTAPMLYYQGRMSFNEQLTHRKRVLTFFQNTALAYLERISYIVFSMALLLQCYLPSNPIINRLLDVNENEGKDEKNEKDNKKDEKNFTNDKIINPTMSTTLAINETMTASNPDGIDNPFFDWSDDEEVINSHKVDLINALGRKNDQRFNDTNNNNTKGDKNDKGEKNTDSLFISNASKSYQPDITMLFKLHTAINDEIEMIYTQRLDNQCCSQDQDHSKQYQLPIFTCFCEAHTINTTHGFKLKHERDVTNLLITDPAIIGGNNNTEKEKGKEKNEGKGFLSRYSSTPPKVTNGNGSIDTPSITPDQLIAVNGKSNPYILSIHTTDPLLEQYYGFDWVQYQENMKSRVNLMNEQRNGDQQQGENKVEPITQYQSGHFTKSPPPPPPPPPQPTPTLKNAYSSSSINSATRLSVTNTPHHTSNNIPPNRQKQNLPLNPLTHSDYYPTHIDESHLISRVLFTPEEILYYNKRQALLCKTLSIQNQEHTFSIQKALHYRKQQRLKQGFLSRLINKSKYRDIDLVSPQTLIFLKKIDFSELPTIYIPLLEPRPYNINTKSTSQLSIGFTPIVNSLQYGMCKLNRSNFIPIINRIHDKNNHLHDDQSFSYYDSNGFVQKDDSFDQMGDLSSLKSDSSFIKKGEDTLNIIASSPNHHYQPMVDYNDAVLSIFDCLNQSQVAYQQSIQYFIQNHYHYGLNGGNNESDGLDKNNHSSSFVKNNSNLTLVDPNNITIETNNIHQLPNGQIVTALTMSPLIKINPIVKEEKINNKKDEKKEDQAQLITQSEIIPLDPDLTMQHFIGQKPRILKHIADLFLLANLPLESYAILKTAQEAIQKEKESNQDHLFAGAIAHSKSVSILLLDISRGAFPLGFTQFERLFFQILNCQQIITNLVSISDLIIKEKVSDLYSKIDYIRSTINEINDTYTNHPIDKDKVNISKWEKLDHLLNLLPIPASPTVPASQPSDQSNATQRWNDLSKQKSIELENNLIDSITTTLIEPLVNYDKTTTILPSTFLPSIQSSDHLSSVPLGIIPTTTSNTNTKCCPDKNNSNNNDPQRISIFLPTPSSPIDWSPIFEMISEIQRLPSIVSYYLSFVRYEYNQFFSLAQTLFSFSTEQQPQPFLNIKPQIPLIPINSNPAHQPPIKTKLSLLNHLHSSLSHLVHRFTPHLSYNSLQPRLFWSSHFSTFSGTIGLGLISSSQKTTNFSHYFTHPTKDSLVGSHNKIVMQGNPQNYQHFYKNGLVHIKPNSSILSHDDTSFSPFRQLTPLIAPIFEGDFAFDVGCNSTDESNISHCCCDLNNCCNPACSPSSSLALSAFTFDYELLQNRNVHELPTNEQKNQSGNTLNAQSHDIEQNNIQHLDLLQLLPMFTTSHLAVERRFWDEIYIAYMSHQRSILQIDCGNSEQPLPNHPSSPTPIAHLPSLLPYHDSLLLSNPGLNLTQARNSFSNHFLSLRNGAQITSSGNIGSEREKAQLTSQLSRSFAQFYSSFIPRLPYSMIHPVGNGVDKDKLQTGKENLTLPSNTTNNPSQPSSGHTTLDSINTTTFNKDINGNATIHGSVNECSGYVPSHLSFDELLHSTIKLTFFFPPSFLTYISPPQPQSQSQSQVPSLLPLLHEKDREKITQLTPFEMIRVMFGQSHCDMYRYFNETYYGFARHNAKHYKRGGQHMLGLLLHVIMGYYKVELNNCPTFSPCRLVAPLLYNYPDANATIIAPKLVPKQLKGWLDAINWYNNNPTIFTQEKEQLVNHHTFFLNPLFDLTRVIWGLIVQYVSIHNVKLLTTKGSSFISYNNTHNRYGAFNNDVSQYSNSFGQFSNHFVHFSGNGHEICSQRNDQGNNHDGHRGGVNYFRSLNIATQLNQLLPFEYTLYTPFADHSLNNSQQSSMQNSGNKENKENKEVQKNDKDNKRDDKNNEKVDKNDKKDKDDRKDERNDEPHPYSTFLIAFPPAFHHSGQQLFTSTHITSMGQVYLQFQQLQTQFFEKILNLTIINHTSTLPSSTLDTITNSSTASTIFYQLTQPYTAFLSSHSDAHKVSQYKSINTNQNNLINYHSHHDQGTLTKPPPSDVHLAPFYEDDQSAPYNESNGPQIGFKFLGNNGDGIVLYDDYRHDDHNGGNSTHVNNNTTNNTPNKDHDKNTISSVNIGDGKSNGIVTKPHLITQPHALTKSPVDFLYDLLSCNVDVVLYLSNVINLMQSLTPQQVQKQAALKILNKRTRDDFSTMLNTSNHISVNHYFSTKTSPSYLYLTDFGQSTVNPLSSTRPPNMPHLFLNPTSSLLIEASGIRSSINSYDNHNPSSLTRNNSILSNSDPNYTKKLPSITLNINPLIKLDKDFSSVIQRAKMIKGEIQTQNLHASSPEILQSTFLNDRLTPYLLSSSTAQLNSSRLGRGMASNITPSIELLNPFNQQQKQLHSTSFSRSISNSIIFNLFTILNLTIRLGYYNLSQELTRGLLGFTGLIKVPGSQLIKTVPSSTDLNGRYIDYVPTPCLTTNLAPAEFLLDDHGNNGKSITSSTHPSPSPTVTDRLAVLYSQINLIQPRTIHDVIQRNKIDTFGSKKNDKKHSPQNILLKSIFSPHTVTTNNKPHSHYRNNLQRNLLFQLLSLFLLNGPNLSSVSIALYIFHGALLNPNTPFSKKTQKIIFSIFKKSSQPLFMKQPQFARFLLSKTSENTGLPDINSGALSFPTQYPTIVNQNKQTSNPINPTHHKFSKFHHNNNLYASAPYEKSMFNGKSIDGTPYIYLNQSNADQYGQNPGNSSIYSPFSPSIWSQLVFSPIPAGYKTAALIDLVSPTQYQPRIPPFANDDHDVENAHPLFQERRNGDNKNKVRDSLGVTTKPQHWVKSTSGQEGHGSGTEDSGENIAYHSPLLSQPMVLTPSNKMDNRRKSFDLYQTPRAITEHLGPDNNANNNTTKRLTIGDGGDIQAGYNHHNNVGNHSLSSSQQQQQQPQNPITNAIQFFRSNQRGIVSLQNYISQNQHPNRIVYHNQLDTSIIGYNSTIVKNRPQAKSIFTDMPFNYIGLPKLQQLFSSTVTPPQGPYNFIGTCVEIKRAMVEGKFHPKLYTNSEKVYSGDYESSSLLFNLGLSLMIIEDMIRNHYLQLSPSHSRNPKSDDELSLLLQLKGEVQSYLNHYQSTSNGILPLVFYHRQQRLAQIKVHLDRQQGLLKNVRGKMNDMKNYNLQQQQQQQQQHQHQNGINLASNINTPNNANTTNNYNGLTPSYNPALSTFHQSQGLMDSESFSSEYQPSLRLNNTILPVVPSAISVHGLHLSNQHQNAANNGKKVGPFIPSSPNNTNPPSTAKKNEANQFSNNSYHHLPDNTINRSKAGLPLSRINSTASSGSGSGNLYEPSFSKDTNEGSYENSYNNNNSNNTNQNKVQYPITTGDNIYGEEMDQIDCELKGPIARDNQNKGTKSGILSPQSASHLDQRSIQNNQQSSTLNRLSSAGVLTGPTSFRNLNTSSSTYVSNHDGSDNKNININNNSGQKNGKGDTLRQNLSERDLINYSKLEITSTSLKSHHDMLDDNDYNNHFISKSVDSGRDFDPISHSFDDFQVKQPTQGLSQKVIENTRFDNFGSSAVELGNHVNTNAIGHTILNLTNDQSYTDSDEEEELFIPDSLAFLPLNDVGKIKTLGMTSDIQMKSKNEPIKISLTDTTPKHIINNVIIDRPVVIDDRFSYNLQSNKERRDGNHESKEILNLFTHSNVLLGLDEWITNRYIVQCTSHRGYYIIPPINFNDDSIKTSHENRNTTSTKPPKKQTPQQINLSKPTVISEYEVITLILKHILMFQYQLSPFYLHDIQSIPISIIESISNDIKTIINGLLLSQLAGSMIRSANKETIITSLLYFSILRQLLLFLQPDSTFIPFLPSQHATSIVNHINQTLQASGWNEIYPNLHHNTNNNNQQNNQALIPSQIQTTNINTLPNSTKEFQHETLFSPLIMLSKLFNVEKRCQGITSLKELINTTLTHFLKTYTPSPQDPPYRPSLTLSPKIMASAMSCSIDTISQTKPTVTSLLPTNPTISYHPINTTITMSIELTNHTCIGLTIQPLYLHSYLVDGFFLNMDKNVHNFNMVSKDSYLPPRSKITLPITFAPSPQLLMKFALSTKLDDEDVNHDMNHGLYNNNFTIQIATIAFVVDGILTAVPVSSFPFYPSGTTNPFTGRNDPNSVHLYPHLLTSTTNLTSTQPILGPQNRTDSKSNAYIDGFYDLLGGNGVDNGYHYGNDQQFKLNPSLLHHLSPLPPSFDIYALPHFQNDGQPHVNSGSMWPLSADNGIDGSSNPNFLNFLQNPSQLTTFSLHDYLTTSHDTTKLSLFDTYKPIHDISMKMNRKFDVQPLPYTPRNDHQLTTKQSHPGHIKPFHTQCYSIQLLPPLLESEIEPITIPKMALVGQQVDICLDLVNTTAPIFSLHEVPSDFPSSHHNTVCHDRDEENDNDDDDQYYGNVDDDYQYNHTNFSNIDRKMNKIERGIRVGTQDASRISPLNILDKLTDFNEIQLTLYCRPKSQRWLNNYDFSTLPRPISTLNYSSVVITSDDIIDRDQIDSDDFDTLNAETNTTTSPPLPPEDNAGWYVLRHGVDYELDIDQVQNQLPIKQHKNATIELFLTPHFSSETISTLLVHSEVYMDRYIKQLYDVNLHNNNDEQYDIPYGHDNRQHLHGLTDENEVGMKTSTDHFTTKGSDVEFEFYLDIQFSSQYTRKSVPTNDLRYNSYLDSPNSKLSNLETYFDYTRFQTAYKWITTFSPAIVINDLQMVDIPELDDVMVIDPKNLGQDKIHESSSNTDSIMFLGSISNHSHYPIDLESSGDNNYHPHITTSPTTKVQLLDGNATVPPFSTMNILFKFPLLPFQTNKIMKDTLLWYQKRINNLPTHSNINHLNLFNLLNTSPILAISLYLLDQLAVPRQQEHLSNHNNRYHQPLSHQPSSSGGQQQHKISHNHNHHYQLANGFIKITLLEDVIDSIFNSWLSSLQQNIQLIPSHLRNYSTPNYTFDKKVISTGDSIRGIDGIGTDIDYLAENSTRNIEKLLKTNDILVSSHSPLASYDDIHLPDLDTEGRVNTTPLLSQMSMFKLSGIEWLERLPPLCDIKCIKLTPSAYSPQHTLYHQNKADFVKRNDNSTWDLSFLFVTPLSIQQWIDAIHANDIINTISSPHEKNQTPPVNEFTVTISTLHRCSSNPLNRSTYPLSEILGLGNQLGQTEIKHHHVSIQLPVIPQDHLRAVLNSVNPSTSRSNHQVHHDHSKISNINHNINNNQLSFSRDLTLLIDITYGTLSNSLILSSATVGYEAFL